MSRLAATHAPAVASTRVRLHGPVDPAHTLRRLVVFSHDLTVRRAGNTQWCAFRTPDGPASVAYRRFTGTEVDVEAYGPGAQRALDAAADHLGAHDRPESFVTDHPVLLPLLRRFEGLRFGRSGRMFERLIPVVLAQKVTGAGAARAWRRLLLHYGAPAPGPLEGLRVPPAPARLRELAYYDFHPLGVERRRARTILEVVRRADRLERLSAADPAVAYARLCALPGIGPWTAASVTSAVHGDPDAVPIGDYHLPHMVAHALAGEPRGTDDLMLELLEPFRPHRGRVLALLKMSGAWAPRFGPRLPVRDIRHH